MGKYSDIVDIVGVLVILAALAIALGLAVESTVPGATRIIDIAAAVFGVATWVAPLLVAAMNRNRKPATIFAGVGVLIRIIVVAACLSAVGVSLALLALAFGQAGTGAWIALFTIASFWLASGGVIYFPRRRSVPIEQSKRSPE